VTSPQAFEGLRLAGRGLWRAETNLAVPDHNVPTPCRVCRLKPWTPTARISASPNSP
jgi:3-isopropylmalate/(R)-2-methylmalate dehydratase large subunit